MAKKNYLASRGLYSGRSGFVNYIEGMPIASLKDLHQKMKSDLGEFVIVDGNDDWSAPVEYRPATFVETFVAETGHDYLATYHTGVSGIAKSGIVVSPYVFGKLAEWYKAKFGVEITEVVEPRYKSKAVLIHHSSDL